MPFRFSSFLLILESFFQFFSLLLHFFLASILFSVRLLFGAAGSRSRESPAVEPGGSCVVPVRRLPEAALGLPLWPVLTLAKGCGHGSTVVCKLSTSTA